MEERTNVDFLNQYAGKGLEDLGAGDFQVPFLKILQTNHEQVSKNSQEYIEGAEPGLFFNSLTSKLYGDTVRLVVIKVEPCFLEWQPNMGGFVAKHNIEPDGIDKSNFGEWKLPNGNIVQQTYNYYVLNADDPKEGLMILSLTGGNIKHAKNWNTQLSTACLPNGASAPQFANIWELKTAFNKKDQFNWFAIGTKSSNVTKKGFISKEMLDNYVISAQNALETQEVKADYAQLETSRVSSEEDLLNDASEY